MSKRTPPTHPRLQRQLVELGQRLRAARMRRNMTQAQLAERVGVSLPTIAKLEAGNPTTSMASLVRALSMLGLEGDLEQLAAADPVGRELQDGNLMRPSSARRR